MTLALPLRPSWPHAVPTPSSSARAARRRTGDAVAELAARYAGEMNACAFATALREHRVSQRNYTAFIATMYPVVVGFNGALIRSISKLDHVRNSSFVKVVARQLEEEQAHNQLWRAMLEVFDIDHESLYDELQEYCARLSADEMNARMTATLEDVRRDLSAGGRPHFDGSPFPSAVLALHHHLAMTASDPDIPYWEHFASQAAIEMAIYDVVNATILPGVLHHPELDRGVSSTHWWLEHGKNPVADAAARTDEEKHLALSRSALNRSETANALAADVEARAEDTLRLFAATLIAQHPGQHTFPIERFRRQ
jgi:hypothetical protein